MAPDTSSHGRVARFGMFEFNLGTLELWKNGSRRNLNGQPAHALALLLENAGQAVTREALRNRIWPEDTFVDFEHSLRVAINRIRELLGDSADSPRFIETVRGRGWRFIAPIEWEDGNEITCPAVQQSRGLSLPEAKRRNHGDGAVSGSDRSKAASGDALPQAAMPAETPLPSKAARRGFRNTVWIGLAMVATLAFTYLFWPRGEPQVTGFTQLTDDGLKKSDGAPLLTDGSRVYFWEYRGDGLVLASAPVDGGEVAEVHVPPGFVTSDLSKDGKEFLGCGRAPDGVVSLATVSAPGKSLLWFTQLRGPASDPPWACQAVWSPDRKLISSSVPNGVIEVRLDGGSIRQIADVDGRPSWPRWSPNGRKLVFSVLKPKAETFSLWQVNADGSQLHTLRFPGNGFTLTCCGSWTPNGKFLLFEAEQSGRRDIWAVPETGRPWPSAPKPVRLTSGPLNYFWPVANRNGTEILVLGEENRGELMRFDLKSRSFVEFLGGISAAEVTFSRDRKWVAYVTYPDYTLWCARADGSDAHQLTYPPLEAREPHWSPDGRQIAFQGISHRDHYKIYLVPSDGGAVQEAMTGSGEQSVGTWWPDGRGLLYDEPLYRHDPSQMFLHQLDLSTRKTSRIPGSGGSWTARLSPDGRYIATLDAAPMADSRHLFILEAATGRRVFSLTMSEAIHEPTWSRDGQYVYFATLDPPAPALYRVRTRDKKLERLASLKGFPVAGLWTGVAPDGSPLLLRDTSTEEIYALHVRWR